MIKVSEVLRQAKKELEGVPEGRNFPKYVAINWVCDTIRQSLVIDAQKFLKEANEDFDSAIVLALFDEAKAVVDSGMVDSFEIALATIRMTLPEQVAVVALAVRKGIEIRDLTRWGLKE